MEFGVSDVATVIEDFLRVEREQKVEGVLEDLVSRIEEVLEFGPMTQALPTFSVGNLERVKGDTVV